MKIQNAYGLKCNSYYIKTAESKKTDRNTFTNKPCVDNSHKACEVAFGRIYNRAKDIGTSLMGKIKNVVTPIGKDDNALDIMQDIGRDIISEKINETYEQSPKN